MVGRRTFASSECGEHAIWLSIGCLPHDPGWSNSSCDILGSVVVHEATQAERCVVGVGGKEQSRVEVGILGSRRY